MAFILCSFADLQKPQLELDGKACAAVGQNGLMALYDLLFSQVNQYDFDNSGNICFVRIIIHKLILSLAFSFPLYSWM